MKKTINIFLLICIALLLTGCWDFTSGFDEEGYKVLKFKDAAFKARLVAAFDANGDGEVSWKEANDATAINCGIPEASVGEADPIRSIDGIHYFLNATSLDFSGNELSGTIDLSDLKKLKNIDFTRNSPGAPGAITLIILDIGRKDAVDVNVDESTQVEYHPENQTRISFEDATFKSRLVAQFDTDKDREISVTEAEKAAAVEYNDEMKIVVDCDNTTGAYTPIISVSEIRYFRYAQVLLFAGNDISGVVDLTALKKLEEIDFSSNSAAEPGKITEIRISKTLEDKVTIRKDEETIIKYVATE